MDKAYWYGPQGAEYELTVCDYYGAWSDQPGLYMFAHHDRTCWRPLYVGQAKSFMDRMCNHERWLEAAELGARAVLARVEKSAWEREIIETQMIEQLSPMLNKQHRSSAVGMMAGFGFPVRGALDALANSARTGMIDSKPPQLGAVRKLATLPEHSHGFGTTGFLNYKPPQQGLLSALAAQQLQEPNLALGARRPGLLG